MPDIYDQAAEIEQMQRQIALDAQAAAYAAQPAVSAYECEECGETIPEARRAAAPGCRCCTACQQEIERYGKTRFAAGRN